MYAHISQRDTPNALWRTHNVSCLPFSQDNLYWTMNTNAYKFGFSGSDNASFYGSYDMNDHLSRMSIGRTNWDYHPMVNVADDPENTVARSVQIGDTDEHSEAEEC